jgi:hypothetical protein
MYDMHSPQVPDTALCEHPITRAIALIGIPSGRCNRRISAQSSGAKVLAAKDR